jgi:hypothetical protein
LLQKPLVKGVTFESDAAILRTEKGELFKQRPQFWLGTAARIAFIGAAVHTLVGGPQIMPPFAADAELSQDMRSVAHLEWHRRMVMRVFSAAYLVRATMDERLWLAHLGDHP